MSKRFNERLLSLFVEMLQIIVDDASEQDILRARELVGKVKDATQGATGKDMVIMVGILAGALANDFDLRDKAGEFNDEPDVVPN